jgi:hypothetical protein
MTACRWEADVLRAAREDRWPDNLRRHLAECDDCTAAASIAPWMATFANIDVRQYRLPDPSIVWLKARLLQGTVDAARVARPLNVAQLIAYVVVAGGWAAVMMWKWSDFEAWLRNVTPADVIVATSSAPSVSMSFLGTLFVLASMTVMLALHTIMAED